MRSRQSDEGGGRNVGKSLVPAPGVPPLFRSGEAAAEVGTDWSGEEVMAALCRSVCVSSGKHTLSS